MRRFAAAALAFLALGGWSAVRADEDEGGEDGIEQEGGDDSGGGGGRHRGADRGARLADDVGVRLALARRRGEPAVRVLVKNQGANPQAGVAVELHADAVGGALLWSATVDLAPGRSAGFRVSLEIPDGTTVLVATASLAGATDQDPSDNEATVFLGSGGGSSSSSTAARGAALYAANCVSCHGTDARGTSNGPWIRGVEAEEIAEAIREGEDGMPTFPGLSAADVRALAAFLRNPEAVEPPAPPPPPPPPAPGTSPTYAGHVKALLDSRCAACHGGRNASGGIRLDTYRNASANASAALAAAEAGRMPQGGPALTASEIALLRDWIHGGKL